MPILQSGESTPRRNVFGEGFAHDVADIDIPEASLLYRWVIDGNWKLILSYDGKQGRHAVNHEQSARAPQLYDLLADPTENNNLAAQKPEIVRRLAIKLQDWWPVTQRTVLALSHSKTGLKSGNRWT